MVGKSTGRLTEAFIRSIKEPCKHGDGHGGHGLTFVVRDTGPAADSVLSGDRFSQSTAENGAPGSVATLSSP